MSAWAGTSVLRGVPPGRGVLPQRRSLMAWAVAGGAAITAMAVAQAGTKLALVTAGLFVLMLGLLLVRNRPLFVLQLLVMTLQFMLIKSFGPIDPIDIGGAPSIYMTSLDVWLLVLYVLWFWEGTLFRELKGAFIWGVALLPLLPAIPAVLSLLTATNLYLVAAELVRMAWMAGLFLYVALRLRSRRDLIFVVGALVVVVVIQAAVAAVEWRTHRSIGLSFLGEESNLYVRTDAGSGTIARASGTVIHPDFLAALVVPVGLIALSLAINLRRRSHRLLALAAAVIAVVPLAASGARAALAGAAAGVTLLGAVYLWRGRLRLTWMLTGLSLAGVAAGLQSSRIADWLYVTVGNPHVPLEVESRLQLNQLAITMFQSSPIVGIGLNNFQAVFHQFDQFGFILAGYPVHNLYLLVLAETGLLGLLAMLLVGGLLFRIAFRVSRTADPLIAAIGLGIAASFVFFAVEESVTFSLREDMPLALFWLLSGLAVAAMRISRGGGTARAGMAHAR